jgi:putative transposase
MATERLDREARVFTVIDIRWAFNLIPVAEAAKPYTTFYGTRQDFYRYRRMTFGFKNAPAFWNEYVTSLFKDLSYVCIYVDDLLIASRTVAEHLEHLLEVLDRLERYTLPVRWQKIKLMRDCVQYLGVGWRYDEAEKCLVHEPLPETVDAIRNWATPTNRKELLQFLGLVRWISKYVRGLEKSLRQFRDLNSPKNKWDWTPEHEHAFRETKELCAQHLALSTIVWDETGMLIVRTDASDWGLGAALFQTREDGTEVLVGVYSYAYSGAQQRWSTINQEAYSIVKALGHWRHWLFGRPFRLETDHKPLIWLVRSVQDGSGSQMNERWLTTLKTFDVEVKHIPGNQNVIADALSRPGCVHVTKDQRRNDPELMRAAVEGTGVMIPLRPEAGSPTPVYEVNFLRMDEAPPDDLFYAACYAVAYEGSDPETWSVNHRFASVANEVREIAEDLFVERGRLCVTARDPDRTLILVPDSLRAAICTAYHDSPFGGHYGVEQTRRAIEQKFRLRDAEAFVKEWVKTCEVCQLTAPHAGGSWFHMKPFEIETPWTTVHADLLDMVVPSHDEMRYVLVVRCGSSGFTELCPLQTKGSEEVARAFNSIFGTHGAPRTLVVDPGSEALGKVADLADSWGIRVARTSPGAHHVNGMAERAIEEVRAYLRKLCPFEGDTEGNPLWSDFIPFAQLVINTKQLERLNGLSPMEVLNARKARGPIDRLVDDPDARPTTSFPEHLHRANTRRVMAQEKLKDARQKMAEQHSRKRRRGGAQALAVGDKVLLAHHASGPGMKQQRRWEGGATVKRLQNDGLRVTIERADGTLKEVHAQEVKRLHVRPEHLQPVPEFIPFLSDGQLKVVPEEPAESDQPPQPVLRRGSGGGETGQQLAASVPTSDAPTVPAGPEGQPDESLVSEDEDLPLGVYTIDKVLAMRMSPLQIRVRWQGYGPEHDTWENVDQEGLRVSMQNFKAANNLKHNGNFIAYPLSVEEIDRVMKLKHTHRDRQYAVATVELVGDDREYDVHMQYLPTELFNGFVERKWTSRELYERTVAAHRRLVIRELV